MIKLNPIYCSCCKRMDELRLGQAYLVRYEKRVFVSQAHQNHRKEFYFDDVAGRRTYDASEVDEIYEIGCT